MPPEPRARDRWVAARLGGAVPLRAQGVVPIEAFWRRDRVPWPVRLCYERSAPGGPLHAAALAAGTPDADVPPWSGGERLADAAARAGAALLDPQRPVPLEPVTVPKPWGREIWYTGMERRGVARARSNVSGTEALPAGRTLLPFVLALAPGLLGDGDPQRLNLLKVLDPHPEPGLGDLYFEVHREKREVYVVAAVDPGAWPDGTGAIRFGFSPARRADYPDHAAFLRAYGTAVARYRAVREAIDARLDAWRSAEGLAPDAPAPPTIQARWLAEIPGSLRAREARLREAMHAFTRLVPLGVGDVVRVPPLTPHALQHGVRVVEFQTPVYERLILSFGQKVLTQEHWDTEAALRLLADRDDEVDEGAAFLRADRGGSRRERVARFEDFDVWREGPGPSAPPPAPGVRVAHLLRGRADAGGLTAEAGEGWLFPAGSPTAADRDPETLWLYACAPPRGPSGTLAEM